MDKCFNKASVSHEQLVHEQFMNKCSWTSLNSSWTVHEQKVFMNKVVHEQVFMNMNKKVTGDGWFIYPSHILNQFYEVTAIQAELAKEKDESKKCVEERSPEKPKKRKLSIAQQQREEKMKALLAAEASTDESGDFFALKTKVSWYSESNAYDTRPSLV